MAQASAQLRIYQKKIKNAVFQAQKQAARELIQIIIDVIRIRTRLEGQGVKGDLPKLAGSTVKYRQRYSGNLDSETSPNKSNATATGQMIDALKGKASGTRMIFDLKTGKRKGELSGSKSATTNKEVSKYYEERMGEWLELNKEEKDDVFEYAAQVIKEAILKVSK